MVRDMSNRDSITITVELKNGKIFEDRDVPSNVFGEYEGMVAFWGKDCVHVYPMSEVKSIVLHENNDKG